MSVYLLGGSYKGFKLSLPPEYITRPTAVQLKRRIFDSNQNLEHRYFIDLCSGSGSIALEALSRGAMKIMMIEKNRKAVQTLKKNVLSLTQKYPHLDQSIEVISSDVESWLTKGKPTFFNDPMCIIYLDPPYEKIDLYELVINDLKSEGFQGELWLEGCRQKGLPFDTWSNVAQCRFKVYEQGTSYILRLIF